MYILDRTLYKMKTKTERGYTLVILWRGSFVLEHCPERVTGLTGDSLQTSGIIRRSTKLRKYHVFKHNPVLTMLNVNLILSC